MLDEAQVNIRQKLSGLWIVLMLLYIYADFLSLFRPGALQAMLDGFMGPFEVTESALMMASVLMAVPAIVVFFTLILPPAICRWANIVLGVIYAAVNIGNLVGEVWIYYWFFGLVEFVVTLAIVILAWKWPRA